MDDEEDRAEEPITRVRMDIFAERVSYFRTVREDLRNTADDDLPEVEKADQKSFKMMEAEGYLEDEEKFLAALSITNSVRKAAELTRWSYGTWNRRLKYDRRFYAAYLAAKDSARGAIEAEMQRRSFVSDHVLLKQAKALAPDVYDVSPDFESSVNIVLNVDQRRAGQTIEHEPPKEEAKVKLPRTEERTWEEDF